MAHRPLISVVTATYNRSNVLRWAIRSVLAQTYAHWELWVIGDSCTDDTEDVVRSFADPRIRFYNLPENVGEQSGPNNEGCARSRGEYIAFLNHDDLWFPDHLERSLQTLQSHAGDLVYSLADRVQRGGRRQIDGVSKERTYRPGQFVAASCWLFRRSLVDEIGPWRYYRDIRNIPSQDWLFRVWKAGKTIHVVPRVTVIAFGTGSRPGCYANRDEDEQAIYYRRMQDEADLREKELVEILFGQPESLQRSIPHVAGISFQTILRAWLYRFENPVLLAMKVDPTSYNRWRTLGRRGAFIDRLRRIRGLEAKKA